MRLFVLILPRLFRLPKRAIEGLQRAALRYRWRHIGKDVLFDSLGSTFSPETISIGDNVAIGEQAWFGGDITIGKNVMFGPRPTILAANHLYAIVGQSPRFIKPAYPGQNHKPVIVEDEVWVGANVTILGNLRIGIGAVIGAGSVVVGEIAPFTVAVGNPCRSVRRIFDDRCLLGHLTTLGYQEAFALEVIARRNRLLAGQSIPIIDRTNGYQLSEINAL